MTGRFSSRSFGLAALAGGWLAAAAAPSWAEPIGTATDVRRDGHRSEPGATTRVEIEAGDAVLLGDRITTNDSGRIRLSMDDDSVLVVGPGSRLTLDEFVYAGGDSSFVMDLSAGGFRFLTGDMPSSSYTINSPTASVGLRGTDVLATYHVIEQVLVIVVLGGAATAHCVDSPDEVIELQAGMTAEIFCGDTAVSTTTIRSVIPDWAGWVDSPDFNLPDEPGGHDPDDPPPPTEPDPTPEPTPEPDDDDDDRVTA